LKFESATPVRFFFKEKFHIWFIKNPVLVYTPGKVGSSTIVNSLRKSGLPEIQPHSLSSSFPGVYFVYVKLSRYRNIFYIIKSWLLTLKACIYKIIHKYRKLKMVVLIRSPGSRNISAFFEHFHHLKKGEVSNYSPFELEELFYQHGYHDAQEVWLDRELKGVFGIDIYQLGAFKKGQPIIIQKKNIDLFFIRLEDLKPNWNEFSKWLNCGSLDMRVTNRSQYKPYSQLYKKTKELVLKNKEYAQSIEDTKFFRTFYKG